MYRRVLRGRGLGGFFGSILKIFSKAAPLVKKVAKSSMVKKIGRQAFKSALSVGADALEEGNLKHSVHKELNKTKKKVSKALRETSLDIEAETSNKKRKNRKNLSKNHLKKKKKINHTLFN